ncbi:GNAT family N-acetyltransferase [Geminicoccaceae bacterium 1502E]|nr:GNAT family N-acetyltransferase [Geminicoccaceae bacterium 1502E]
MDVVLRGAREDDLPAIRDIYALEVLEGTASFELEPPDAAEMGRRFASVAALGLPWLAAGIDGRLAGYAFAGSYRPRPAYRWSVENSVYVARWARCRQVGRLLLERLVADCEAAGARQMVAVIGDSANLSSVRLHERCGFRHVGTLRHVGYKHGRWLDTVLMQRALGPGAASPPRPG